MVRSLSKNNSGEVALLLDIGSGSIGGAIVDFQKKQKPKIIYSLRHELPFNKNITSDKAVSALRLSLESMLAEFTKKGFLEKQERAFSSDLPEYVICTLSSPWHVSTVRDVNFSFEKTDEIDAHFLNDLVLNEVSEFNEKIDKSDLPNKPYENIEKLFIKFSINGYGTRNPFGKKSKSFNFKIFLSSASSKHLKYIKNIIGRHFPGREIIFRSFSSVFFSTLSDIFPSEDRFLAVHISGETTEISVIKNKAIIETASFPLGRNFMIRKAIKEIEGLDYGTATSMIKMHKSDEVNKKISKKFKDVLETAENDWVELFFDALENLSEEMFLPSRIFVMSGEGYSSLFGELIEAKKDKFKFNTEQAFNVTTIDSGLFSSMVDYEGKERSEPFFAIQAFYEGGVKNRDDFNRKFLL